MQWILWIYSLKDADEVTLIRDNQKLLLPWTLLRLEILLRLREVRGLELMEVLLSLVDYLMRVAEWRVYTLFGEGGWGIK